MQEGSERLAGGGIDPVRLRHTDGRQRVGETLAAADHDEVIAAPLEFLRLLGHLLEEGNRNLRRIVVGGKLDRPPIRLEQHLDGVQPTRGWIDKAVGYQRYPE